MVNYLAILVAGVVGYAIGALWYSVLFGKQWMALMGYSQKDLAKAKQKGMALAYSTTFIATLVMVGVLSYFISLAGASNFTGGLLIGFWAWLGFLATTMLGMVFWENKPFTLYLLTAAHYLVVLLVAGGILGAWN